MYLQYYLSEKIHILSHNSSSLGEVALSARVFLKKKTYTRQLQKEKKIHRLNKRTKRLF